MNKSSRLKFFVYMLALYTLAYIPVTVAETWQTHGSILWAVKNFARKNLVTQQNQDAEITTGKLDSRLKLRKCDKYLQAYLPKGSRETGKTTIGVKCAGSTPWSLHVPVTISVYRNILVANRQLQKDAILAVSDLKLEKHDLADMPYGYLEDKDSVTGMKLKRRVMAGAVLTPAMLKKPRIVSRGQNITILAQSGRMAVRMAGKALENGAAGDRIKVKNIKSGKKLEGVISDAGEVEVDI